MQINTDNLLLIGSLLLLISVLAGKAIRRLGVPTLIFFLLVGIAAGSEGVGGISFDNASLAQFIGIVALNFILFSGGLDTHWPQIRPVLRKGLLLSTVGVLLTAGAVAVFTHYVFGFTFLEGALLGSVVSATDAAAVFSILRGKGIGLKGPLQPMLELESGSNDPMAYFLTITCTALLAGADASPGTLLLSFVREFAIGGLLGAAMGKASVWIINRVRLGAEGLYPVLTLGLALFTYAFTHYLGGNGFLAIYLCALIMGNSPMVHRRSLTRFYDGQAWLMQIVLFLTLGLLVFPSRIIPVIGTGLAISGFLIFVARPLGVFGALAFSGVNRRSKWFLSWVGLRGSVPIVFATYPLLAGVAKADLIFNLVFFISVTSVLLQGTTLSLVAKWLGVAVPESARRRIDPAFEAQDRLRAGLEEIEITTGAAAGGKRIVQLQLPASLTILAIRRGEHFIAPNGSTLLQEGDRLTVLTEQKETLAELQQRVFGSPLP